MKCPICQKGRKPEYVFQLNKTETKDKMKAEYENLEHLSRHMLWGHAQKDVVDLLMGYMQMEMEKEEKK